MSAKTLMIQGTASSVGKSILVTALCRIFKQDGFRVAPFKSQNMALNSFVTTEGGEIGRSQAVQAEAAGIIPSVYMNPILLKPEADARSQVIVLGKVAETLQAHKYYEYTHDLLGIIDNSLQRLSSEYDIIVIEGAGSPAEINLKQHEIVNMRIAHMANAPVLLVGDIDRGGVFAALTGTLHLLDEEERNLVRGFIINKFRGDITLLQPGLDFLEKDTGKPVLGVIPYYRDITIAQEDSVYLDEMNNRAITGGLDIVVIRLPHISNFDDFDPLETSGSHLRYVEKNDKLGNPHLIIIPGSKSTVNDLEFLRHSGLAENIINHANNGTPVIGICGGYQMLGRSIHDPAKVESTIPLAEGLNLLDIDTIFTPEKQTSQVEASLITGRGILSGVVGNKITGYEIHMGKCLINNERGVFRIRHTSQNEDEYDDGTISEAGNVFGTYIHGIFNEDTFCRSFLDSLRRYHGLHVDSGTAWLRLEKEKQYDKLADLVRCSVKMAEIHRILSQGIKPS